MRIIAVSIPQPQLGIGDGAQEAINYEQTIDTADRLLVVHVV
jgi:hypothetical protein